MSQYIHFIMIQMTFWFLFRFYGSTWTISVFEDNAAEYEDVDFQLTVKMYSEADYIKIAITCTYGSSYAEGDYTYSYEGNYEYNLEVNLAAGLTADDFEPLSVE